MGYEDNLVNFSRMLRELTENVEKSMRAQQKGEAFVQEFREERMMAYLVGESE